MLGRLFMLAWSVSRWQLKAIRQNSRVPPALRHHATGEGLCLSDSTIMAIARHASCRMLKRYRRRMEAKQKLLPHAPRRKVMAHS